MIDDERLMAYADDELDAAGRAEVETAAAADPEVARRLAGHVELRRAAAGVFAEVLGEPTPDHLVRAVTHPKVVRPTFGRSRLVPGLAIAASLTVGVICGQLLKPVGQPLALQGGVVTARGDLAKALDSQLAADTGDKVRIGVTFVSSNRDYCRTFSLPQSGLSGVACREDGGWRVPATATAAAETADDYRTASSGLPPAIAAAVDSMIEGDALDGAAEAAARDGGWRHDGGSSK